MDFDIDLTQLGGGSGGGSGWWVGGGSGRWGVVGPLVQCLRHQFDPAFFARFRQCRAATDVPDRVGSITLLACLGALWEIISYLV